MNEDPFANPFADGASEPPPPISRPFNHSSEPSDSYDEPSQGYTYPDSDNTDFQVPLPL